VSTVIEKRLLGPIYLYFLDVQTSIAIDQKPWILIAKCAPECARRFITRKRLLGQALAGVAKRLVPGTRLSVLWLDAPPIRTTAVIVVYVSVFRRVFWRIGVVRGV
jgi:hypothetical protein